MLRARIGLCGQDRELRLGRVADYEPDIKKGLEGRHTQED